MGQVSTEFRFQLRCDQGEEFGIMREEGLVNIRSGENQDVVARTELYGALEAITSKRCTVTAEVASSSLVVPAILNKPLSNFEARPLWVQNGATLTCVRRSLGQDD